MAATKKTDPYEIRRKIKELAPGVAEGIKTAAAQARNETEFRANSCKVIAEAAEEIGITLQLALEYHVAESGFVDALYNRFVIEYERPGTMTARPGAKNAEALGQVKRYVEGLAAAEKRGRHRYAGVATDGSFYIFVRYVDGRWQVDRPLEVTARTTEIFLQYLAALTAEKPLTGENLIRDFGVGTDNAKNLVPAFYELAAAGGDDRAAAIFGQWTENFSEACDYETGIAHAKKTVLQKAADLFGIEAKSPKPLPLYFAIHTYFAFICKLIALQLAMVYRFKRRPGNIVREMLDLGPEGLRARLHDVERGDFFDKLGIKNFLEADFFSWYLDRWSPELAETISPVVAELYRYDFPGTETQPEEYRDILQSIYQDLMPRELRHNLGEYYTPDWLVERILNQLNYHGDPRVRVLDPACGSGTFLFHEIRRVRAKGQADLADERFLLESILDNVVGFDLNPVAVTTARTSYLLALGELLDFQDEEIHFPVYTADSIMTPFRGETLQQAGAHVVETTVGEFRLPEKLAGLRDVSRLLDLVRLHAGNELPVETFLGKAGEAFPDLKDDDLRHVKFTYERILELNREGKNGIWGAILKNAFAPVFAAPFDLIAGNPPWINWEHLPEKYRDSTKGVWFEYGLFPHSGMDTILGKGKKDISTLMTFVAMDKYLKKGGKLGFVITQSVFKTGGAGQGFRRFKLGDGPDIKVRAVDDMVELKPFPGVGNRTATMLLEKGRKTTYPVTYNYWKKKTRASLKPEMTLAEIQELTTYAKLVARPVSKEDPTSAWMTGRKKALAAADKVLGKSDYEAHAGVYTGGANAVYWVDIIKERPDGLLVVKNITEGAKRKVPQVEAVIEPDLVYPLLRGRDVKRWRAVPSAHIIMVQDPVKRRGIDEAKMKERWPRMYAYLKQFEGALRERAAYKRYFKETAPFYSMFNVGDYTFAPYKVGWREVASKIDGTVFSSSKGNLIIPDHKIIIIPAEAADDAFYMSSIINSAPFRFTAESYITISPDPHIVQNVRIIAYKKTSADCKALTSLSGTAHELAASGEEEMLADVEVEINERVAHLYGITAAELKEIKKSLEEMKG